MHFYDVPEGNFGGDGIVGGTPARCGRHRLRHPPPRDRPGRPLLLRRRRRQRGGLPRGAERLARSGTFPSSSSSRTTDTAWGRRCPGLLRQGPVRARVGVRHAPARRRRDGHLAVREAIGEAIDRARKEKLPSLVEAETYRLPRPLDVRPGQVPDEGGGGGDDAPRPHPQVRHVADGASGRPRPTSSRSTRRCWPASTRSGSPTRVPGPPAETLYEDVYVRTPYIHARPPRRTRPGGPRRRRTGCPKSRGLRPEPPARGGLAMAIITMREALNQAMGGDAPRRPYVFLLGEEVGLPGRLQGHPGAAPGVRRVAGARHAHRRGGASPASRSARLSSASGPSPR